VEVRLERLHQRLRGIFSERHVRDELHTRARQVKLHDCLGSVVQQSPDRCLPGIAVPGALDVPTDIPSVRLNAKVRSFWNNTYKRR